VERTLAHAVVVVLTLASLSSAGTRPSIVAADGGQETAASGGHAAHQQHPGSTTEHDPETGVAPLLGNLGDHQHPITSRSPLAQRYFDEGLLLAFGFNHAEAVRSFRDAATLDPSCALCYWGIALALGPHINAPMNDAAVPEAYAALQRALALAPTASAAEQAYIQALAARYAPAPVADRAPLDRAYADAMREVARRYPDDLDAATLFAESLMNLTPWEYWTKDGQPTEHTAEIVATLEAVLARNPNHPGANHYYIHAVEASQTPERAVPSAERLERLAPGAGHLVHMPAHIYWRVGRYQDAVRINHDAIRSDETYFRVGGVADLPTHGLYVFGYYPHNIHFVFAGAQMSGQSALALEAARKLVAQVPDEVVRALPALEDFPAMPLFALVRFGRWDEVLREPRPADEFRYTTGLWHWVRGLAYLRQGQLDRAEAEATQLAAIAAEPALREQLLFSRSTAATLLELASNVLAGELAGARGRPQEQITRLERAVAIQDELPYMEPPAWFYPVRQNLGAALLAAGRPAEAEAVYREDLRQYPSNGWALFGLTQSLRAQGRAEEAAEAQRRFEQAWQHADVTLASSRF
jgi:tetratricopeptide (TPR) repeat protein